MKKVHRFLLPPEISHQLRDVLKLRSGEKIDLLIGQGLETRAKIVSTIGPVKVEIDSIRQNRSEPTVKVTLYAAILKRENFELVVQKATEVGATEIVPIISARTIKTGIKIDRLQKIAAEATEQSGRGVVPIIHQAMNLKQALIDCAKNDVNVILHTEGGAQWPSQFASVGLFVGPEGGWSDEEIQAAKAASCQIGNLGPLILRAETAAIIAVYLVAHKII